MSAAHGGFATATVPASRQAESAAPRTRTAQTRAAAERAPGVDAPSPAIPGDERLPSHPPLTACVINYNGEDYLECSLGALASHGAPLSEVVLVDNASTDGSRLLVETRFPGVRLVALPRNLGAAAARNVALQQARTDLVLLIDNDVAPAPGAIEALASALQRTPDAAVAMPAIVHAGDGATIQYDGADAHFLGQQILHHEGVPYGSAPLDEHDIGSVVSACILVDRSRLPAPGPGSDGGGAFDEDFFIYFEDHDFGYRLRLMGRRVLAVPAASCMHGAGTQGVSIRALGGYSRLRIAGHIRNRWIFLIKNFSVRSLVLLFPVLATYEGVQFVGVVKKGWLGEWGRAAWWIATHARDLLARRRHIQRSRRCSDRILLQGGPVPLRSEATATSVERAARRLLDGIANAYWRLIRGML
ncbi:MAG TPA: glycosyltransferase family 2 protein [Gemmatimonadaceae bacterium]|nr:glycosyltransferase family 2 protein [Gemmatimonadaceae bacterium]